MELSLIIPLYNEENNIDELVDRLSKSLNDIELTYELILVNDGSTDETNDILCKFNANSNVKIITLIKNYGQSIANRAGIENATGKYILCMDGDLQHKPEDIPKIVSYLDKGYDLVSVYKDSGSKQSIGSKIAHRLISRISKTDLRYYGISVKAFRRDLINTGDLYGNTHRYIGISLAKNAKKYIEVPITIDNRETGKSKYRHKQWSVLFELFTLKLMLKDIDGLSKYFRKAGLVLGFLGVVGVAITICLDIFADLNIGRDFIIEFIFMNFVIIVGILFFILGLVLHIYQKESSSTPYIIRSND
ncbi:MAG: hypothetical protein C0596_12830 [Marinilabiliales bacterium]|nr:MAG: hypothetical protein C0596_12830 [Marinilabiliales bacterium]